MSRDEVGVMFFKSDSFERASSGEPRQSDGFGGFLEGQRLVEGWQGYSGKSEKPDPKTKKRTQMKIQTEG